MTEKGWICPVCGKGLAPWVRECDCVISPQPVIPYPYPQYPQYPAPYEPTTPMPFNPPYESPSWTNG